MTISGSRKWVSGVRKVDFWTSRTVILAPESGYPGPRIGDIVTQNRSFRTPEPGKSYPRTEKSGVGKRETRVRNHGIEGQFHGIRVAYTGPRAIPRWILVERAGSGLGAPSKGLYVRGMGESWSILVRKVTILDARTEKSGARKRETRVRNHAIEHHNPGNRG